jgi:hypothetical protein
LPYAGQNWLVWSHPYRGDQTNQFSAKGFSLQGERSISLLNRVASTRNSIENLHCSAKDNYLIDPGMSLTAALNCFGRVLACLIISIASALRGTSTSPMKLAAGLSLQCGFLAWMARASLRTASFAWPCCPE